MSLLLEPAITRRIYVKQNLILTSNLRSLELNQGGNAKSKKFSVRVVREYNNITGISIKNRLISKDESGPAVDFKWFVLKTKQI